jgi:hypothetical protein
MQESLTQLRKKEYCTQQENISRKNTVCIVREITKINKKSAGHGTNI